MVMGYPKAFQTLFWLGMVERISPGAKVDAMPRTNTDLRILILGALIAWQQGWRVFLDESCGEHLPVFC